MQLKVSIVTLALLAWMSCVKAQDFPPCDEVCHGDIPECYSEGTQTFCYCGDAQCVPPPEPPPTTTTTTKPPVNPPIDRCPRGQANIDEHVNKKKPCKKCPKPCKKKVTLHDIGTDREYHGMDLKRGLHGYPGFTSTVSVNSKGYTVIEVKNKKGFCIHAFSAKYVGTCSNITATVVDSKGNNISVGICQNDKGDFVIPKGVIDGRKITKFFIELCPDSCKLLEWILCVCIAKLTPPSEVQPNEGMDQCPGIEEGGTLEDPIPSSKRAANPCRICPAKCQRKISMWYTRFTKKIHGQKLAIGYWWYPGFSYSTNLNKKGYTALTIKRKKPFCIHSFYAEFVGFCKWMTASVSGNRKVKMCIKGPGHYAIPRGVIDGVKVKKFKIKVSPLCFVQCLYLCVCIE